MIRRLTFRWLIGTILLIAVVVALRMWPHEPLQNRFPVSTTVWSADGELLRVTRAADDQYRLWVPLDQLSPFLVDAFLLKEDRWFYWHPGVNPIALVRASARTYGGGERQGGSTITMQLARMTYRLNTRRPLGKLHQITLAMWLEVRYSKREILEAYLNVVPFGANIQGAGAAARMYFGKSPDRVTLAEALTLAVIPQRPARRAGAAASEQSLLKARADLGRLWVSSRAASAADHRQIGLDIVARPHFAMPFAAPHLVDLLLANRQSFDSRITTTIDSELQRLVERQIHRHLNLVGDTGIRNAAALLVDSRDMAVKAWVGSADYWNESIDGQVNGVVAKRSPGSTLKPFVYALAMDQGVLHPQTIVRDAPTAFGPFAPENFDGRFFGPISAQEALVRSRNIPAVWASSQLTQPSLYQFLRSAGVRDLKSEDFYGLGLALGGAEVSMLELAQLYAMLANDGVLQPLRVQPDSPRQEGVRLISAEASFITLDMLKHHPRPDDDGAQAVRARWPVAWKTGTSWGFRDAWTAGVAGPYVLVVWIGNFQGGGNPAFVGVDAAAPLFFRIVDALNQARASEAIREPAPPPGVSKVAVCAASGDLPNAHCPRTIETWYIPGKSPIRVSQLHRVVAIDPHSGLAACPPYAAGTRFEVFEFWPSDMLRLFQQAGMPRRVPPAMPSCASDDPADAPRIASPLRNVRYALRQSAPQEIIALDASTAGDVSHVFWFDGNALIGTRPLSDGALPWRPTSPGIHLIRVVDDHGRSAERDVEIQFSK